MLSAAQMQMRRSGIGSSEVAAILGVCPHKTAVDVWLSKVAENDGDRTNEAKDAGNELEDAIARMYARRTGADLYAPEETVRHPLHPWALATVDRLSKSGPARIVEVKNVGAHMLDGWGDDGSQDVPEDKLVQVQWQMEVCGEPTADLAALLGGTALSVYPFRRDTEFGGQLVEIVEAFWVDHVLARVPPTPTAEQAQRVAAALYPRSKGNLLAPTDEARALHAELLRLAEEEKALKERSDAAEAVAKAITGDADGYAGLWTWKSDAAGKLRWSELLKEVRPSPALIAKYTGAPGRRFLLKKAGGR